MKSPKVSVIIPVYNAEKTIGGILEKLITQQYKNIEIIVVNDGSKDGSLKILKDFSRKDDRVLLVDQNNAGVSAARNVGTNKATGEFVLYIDSDDDFSEKLITKLIASSSKDVDFVMCGMSINGRVVVAHSAIVNGCKSIISYVLSSLLAKNLFYGPYCKLYRRSIIEDFDVEFPEKVKYGEDTIFVLSYLRCINNMTVLGESLYEYNFQPTGLATANNRNASFRNARTKSLNEFVAARLTLTGRVLYLLLRARWSVAYLKARLGSA